jgi:hypothetical protein
MFRFTIRDVLWLTVVVALGVAWWTERQARHKVDEWWIEHVTREHASNPNDFKRLIEREEPPIPN